LWPTTLYTGVASWYTDLQLSWGAGGSNNGNLRTELINACSAGANMAFSQGFQYDNVNRLMKFTDVGSTTNERDFNYDRYGNAWETYVSGTLPSFPGITAASNVYNTANRRTEAGFIYDEGGNLTSVPNAFCPPANCIQYDAENRQTHFAGTAYQYDGNGKRVTSTINGVTTIYVYDAQGRLAAKYLSSNAILPPCQTCYLSMDHLGSTRLVTDQVGTVISRHDYMPFGEEITNGFAGRGAPWGNSDRVNQKFTGKQRDSETGLDYFGARYYGSALGRFTSPDDGIDQDAEDPQSWNLYSYVRNNPLANVDPDGRACSHSTNAQGQTVITDTDGKGCAELRDNNVYAYDNPGIAMLAGLGEQLNNGHNWAELVSDAGRSAASVIAPQASGIAECITPGGNCDNTNLAMAVLPGALGRAGRVIRILEEAGGVVHLEVKTAQGTYEVIANITREGDKIVLEGAHIQGSGSGQFGPGLRKELPAAAREFMRREGVSAVEVRPGVRTSGANAGRAMRPFTVTR